MLILDSGAVTKLAERSRHSLAIIEALRQEELWPPTVPTVVLAECLQGHGSRDAHENRFLKICNIANVVPEAVARRAALLRRMARRGSAVDALLVAMAEPHGTVLTSDPEDLKALAAHAVQVAVEVL